MLPRRREFSACEDSGQGSAGRVRRRRRRGHGGEGAGRHCGDGGEGRYEGRYERRRWRWRCKARAGPDQGEPGGGAGGDDAQAGHERERQLRPGSPFPPLPKSVACCTPSEVTRCSPPLSGSVAALSSTRPGLRARSTSAGAPPAPSTWAGAPGGAARGGRHRWRRLRGGGSGGSGGGGGLEDAGQAPATEAGEGPGRLQEVPPEGDLLQGASPRAEGQQGGEVGPVQVQRLGVRVGTGGGRRRGEGRRGGRPAGGDERGHLLPAGGDVLYPGQEGLWREVEGEDEAPRRRERGLLEGESGSSPAGGRARTRESSALRPCQGPCAAPTRRAPSRNGCPPGPPAGASGGHCRRTRGGGAGGRGDRRLVALRVAA